jgi:hypothetical protein
MVSERIFFTNKEDKPCDFAGVVAFEVDHQDGTRISYLDLLEANMKKNQFSTLGAAVERIKKVDTAINSKAKIPHDIPLETRNTIQDHRRFAELKVILYYSANNMDDITRKKCFDKKISVISPNGSNLEVQFALSTGLFFGREEEGGGHIGGLEDTPSDIQR